MEEILRMQLNNLLRQNILFIFCQNMLIRAQNKCQWLKCTVQFPPTAHIRTLRISDHVKTHKKNNHRYSKIIIICHFLYINNIHSASDDVIMFKDDKNDKTANKSSKKKNNFYRFYHNHHHWSDYIVRDFY